jgi:hypothetical protein
MRSFWIIVYTITASASTHYVRVGQCSTPLIFNSVHEGARPYDEFFEDTLLLLGDVREGIRDQEEFRSFNNLGLRSPETSIEAAGVNFRGIQERVLKTRYGHLLAHTLRAAVMGTVSGGPLRIGRAFVLEVRNQVLQGDPAKLIDSQHVLYQALASLNEALDIQEVRPFQDAIRTTLASGLYLPMPDFTEVQARQVNYR